MKEKTKSGNYYQPAVKSKDAQFSLPSGLKVNFQDEGHEIIFWVSPLTGNEKVFVDKKNVSQKRTFRRSTKHSFELNENDYEIEFSLTSLIKYTWSCSLYRNGELIKSFEIKDNRSGKSFLLKNWEFILGGFIGVMFAFGYISLYVALGFLAIGILFSFWQTQWFFDISETKAS